MLNKKFLKNIRHTSLVAVTLIGCWLAQGTKLLALPQAEILEKLQPIPVFTVADSQGAPLVATNEGTGKVAGVFISKADANKFVEKLKQENPELGGKVQVVPVSLGEIYEIAQENAKQEDALNFAYVPTQAQVAEAKKINSDYQGGVPLFVAKAGADKGYLTIQQNDQEVIPFFFEEDQVKNLIESFKKAKPDLASSVMIEVVPLEGMLAAMQKGDDEMLKKIVLWPSKESLEFLRSNVPEQKK